MRESGKILWIMTPLAPWGMTAQFSMLLTQALYELDSVRDQPAWNVDFHAIPLSIGKQLPQSHR